MPRLEALGESLVAGLELLSIVDHLLDLAGRELADRVGDGDVGGAAGRLLGSGDLEDTVDVDLEDDLKDGITGLHGRDRSKSELAQRGVVLAVDTLTLEDGELDGGLVVGNGGEGPLLDGGDGLTAGNDGSEDVALHGDTERKRDNIEQKEVGSLGRRGLAGEDTGLDGSTVGNGLIGVDALLELLAVEEVAQKLLDTGNTGGTTDKDDLVDLALLDGSILEDLLNGSEGAVESLGVQLLETSTGDGGVEVLALEERVNLNSGLGGVGESTLGTLASSPQTTESTGVTRDVLLSLPLELLLEVVKKVGIEVLTTKVSVTSGGLDGEDTALDVQEGNIESTTTEVVDQDVPLLLRLAGAETVGNGGGSRLVDDTEDVETGNGAGVLGGLTLVVVEVGRDGDDGLLNLLAELGLGNLLHLRSVVSIAARDPSHKGRIFRMLTLPRTMAEISWGEKVLVSLRYSTWTEGAPSRSTILKGQDSMSFLTVSSSNLRPMRRLETVSRYVYPQSDFSEAYLTSKTVFAGFMAAWFLAASPMRRSSGVKETNEGVVKLPCSLATAKICGEHGGDGAASGGLHVLISTLVPS